jgi:hypothetical protein
MSYKFILDTTILQLLPIEKLNKTNLIRASQSGRFSFYVTPILLKERLNFLFNPKATIDDQVLTVAKFLCDLKWQGFFREPGGPEGIFAIELEGRTYPRYIFNDDWKGNIKRALANFLAGNGCLTEQDKQRLVENDAKWQEKKKDNKKLYLGAWGDAISQWKERYGKLPPPKEESRFVAFCNSSFEKEAIQLINNVESSHPKESLISYWREYKQR